METAAVGVRLGTLRSIWTYPVKSLRRVEHDEVEIEEDGLAGDRRAGFYVTSAEHARSGKTYRGKEDNRLHLIEHPDEAFGAVGERGVDLEMRVGGRHFDAGTVSLILDRWIAEVERALGRALDPLRWRPNLFVASEAAVSERDLAGTLITIGTVALRVLRPIGRCVTTTYDQVTGESDPEVLGFVARERDNNMGVYCDVETPGIVRTGDVLRVLR